MDNKIETIKTDVQLVQDKASDIVIKGQGDVKLATDFLKAVKVRVKKIDEIRKELVNPYNIKVKEINGLLMPEIKTLKEIESTVKKRVSGYLTEQEKLLQDKVGNVTDFEGNKVVIDTKPKSIKTDNATMSCKKVQRFEVVDFTKIPREYLIIDEKKIKEDLKQGCVIEGIRAYEENIIAIR